MFGKKKKKQSADELDASLEAEKGKKVKSVRKKKSKDAMSEVISESVVETVMDDVRKNASVLMVDEGYFGIMVLDSAEIGGFGRKARKNEAIGQIIEYIANRNIATLIPEDWLYEEKIGIIPTPQTVDAMSEFVELKRATYKLVAIDEHAVPVEGLEGSATFDEVYDTIMNGGTMHDVFVAKDLVTDDEPADSYADDGVADDGVADDGYAEDGYSDDGYVEDEVSVDEPLFAGEPALSETTVVAAPVDDEPFADDAPVYEFSSAVAPVEDDTFADYGSEGDVFGDDAYDTSDLFGEVIDDEDDGFVDEKDIPELTEDDKNEFAQAIERTFFKGDLDLNVTTEAFDKLYMTPDNFVEFETNRGEGELERCVGQIAQEVNVQLKRAHTTNLNEMRQLYFKLACEVAERVAAQVDTDSDKDTYFKMANDQINALHDVRLARVDEIVNERLKIINEEWNKELNNVANTAAMSARSQHEKRYSAEHKRRCDRVHDDVLREINNSYEDQRRALSDERRQRAQEMFDMLTSGILDEVGERYSNLLAIETEDARRHHAHILTYIENYRKDDVARARVLAEEQRRRDIVAEAYNQAKAQIEAARSDCQSRVEEMRERIDAANAAAERQILAARTDADTAIKLANEERDAANRRFDELMAKYNNLDEIKSREYEARISAMSQANENTQRELDNLAAAQKRGHVLVGVAATVGIIAALAVGSIIGMQFNTSAIQDKAATAINEQVQEKLDDLKTERDELKREVSNLKENKADTLNSLGDGGQSSAENTSTNAVS